MGVLVRLSNMFSVIRAERLRAKEGEYPPKHTSSPIISSDTTLSAEHEASCQSRLFTPPWHREHGGHRETLTDTTNNSWCAIKYTLKQAQIFYSVFNVHSHAENTHGIWNYLHNLTKNKTFEARIREKMWVKALSWYLLRIKFNLKNKVELSSTCQYIWGVR